AVKLAITLDRAISLKDVTRHPHLTDLAQLIDNRSRQQTGGLLQPLSEPGEEARTTALVCFPYAGGNAVNFQPLAKALQAGGPAVYAVELPGHDVTAESEPFASTEQIVEEVVAEISRLGLTRVLLWGHSSGTAPAVATARKLLEQGIVVEHVFLAAQLLGDAAERRAAVGELTSRGDADITAALSGDSGYTGLAELEPQHAERVGAAYRHDCVSAHRYFVGVLEEPPAVRLPVPITVVVAADDPITAEFRNRHGDWELLAERVHLHELPDGGHYFLRTRPAEAAKAVLHAAERPAREA
ncbi:thioesterase II family protein, partial [Streptomyces sp. NPDC059169]